MPNKLLIICIGALAVAGCREKREPAATPQAAVAPVAPEAPAPAPDEPAEPRVHAAEPPSGQAGAANLPPGHPPTGGLPAGHPPIDGAAVPSGRPARPSGGGPMMAQGPAEEGVVRPLPLEGSGSIAELRSRLAKIADQTKRTALENAFRLVFTVDRPQRDVRAADGILTPLAKDPDAAVASLAERTLGYVRVQSGFDQVGAMRHYARAIELDADYGEAHYAMAFMLAMGDRAAGKTHFDRAMALGVPDTRNLGTQFYKSPGAK